MTVPAACGKEPGSAARTFAAEAVAATQYHGAQSGNVAHARGTMGSADINDVDVTCVTTPALVWDQGDWGELWQDAMLLRVRCGASSGLRMAGSSRRKRRRRRFGLAVTKALEGCREVCVESCTSSCRKTVFSR